MGTQVPGVPGKRFLLAGGGGPDFETWEAADLNRWEADHDAVKPFTSACPSKPFIPKRLRLSPILPEISSKWAIFNL